MMGRILLALMIIVVLASGDNGKTISNNIREIKNTNNQFHYPNTFQLPNKFEPIIIKPKKLEVKISSAKPINKIEYQTFEITAYTANEESTSKRKGHPLYGITASGKKVKENHTIACPKSIPFETKVYIPYFKNTFTCEDRGGLIKEGHIDVYMKSYDSAIEFGRQKLEIHIVGEDGI